MSLFQYPTLRLTLSFSLQVLYYGFPVSVTLSSTKVNSDLPVGPAPPPPQYVASVPTAPLALPHKRLLGINMEVPKQTLHVFRSGCPI